MTAPKVIRKIENPPALDINEVLYANRSMPLHVRLEQRIVWNLLLTLEAADFTPYSVDTGEEVAPTPNKKAAMEFLFNLDDAFLLLTHANSEKETGRRKVWVRFVFGNGVDVISDYNSVDWHGFEDVMNKFDPEVYA